jgi:hypothetical protein
MLHQPGRGAHAPRIEEHDRRVYGGPQDARRRKIHLARERAGATLPRAPPRPSRPRREECSTLPCTAGGPDPHEKPGVEQERFSHAGPVTTPPAPREPCGLAPPGNRSQPSTEKLVDRPSSRRRARRRRPSTRGAAGGTFVAPGLRRSPTSQRQARTARRLSSARYRCDGARRAGHRILQACSTSPAHAIPTAESRHATTLIPAPIV